MGWDVRLPRPLPTGPNPINSTLTFCRSYVVGMLIPKDKVKRACWWDTAEPYHYTRFEDWDKDNLLMIVGEWVWLEAWVCGACCACNRRLHRCIASAARSPPGCLFVAGKETSTPGHRAVTIESNHQYCILARVVLLLPSRLGVLLHSRLGMLLHSRRLAAGGEDHKTGTLLPHDPYTKQVPPCPARLPLRCAVLHRAALCGAVQCCDLPRPALPCPSALRCSEASVTGTSWAAHQSLPPHSPPACPALPCTAAWRSMLAPAGLRLARRCCAGMARSWRLQVHQGTFCGCCCLQPCSTWVA